MTAGMTMEADAVTLHPSACPSSTTWPPWPIRPRSSTIRIGEARRPRRVMAGPQRGRRSPRRAAQLLPIVDPDNGPDLKQK